MREEVGRKTTLQPIVEGFARTQGGLKDDTSHGPSTHSIGVRGLAWPSPRTDLVPGTRAFVEARRQRMGITSTGKGQEWGCKSHKGLEEPWDYR